MPKNKGSQELLRHSLAAEESIKNSHCEERSDAAIPNKLKTKDSKLKTPAQVANLRILAPPYSNPAGIIKNRPDHVISK